VVTFDFAAARTFGGKPQDTGVSGPDPGLFHAAVTADLARSLDIGPGSRITIWAYGLESNLVVERVLPRRGLAGLTLASRTQSEQRPQ
jgi:putative ABC transport system permease protein